MKVVTIVGARPQFIKAAAVSRVLRSLPHVHEVLVHTGQHYDANMSEIFFKELHIPEPDYNLEVGSATHGKQTGLMLDRIEQVLMKENPDWVLTYGDTNSTVAGSLAAAKLHLLTAHVEAGLRSFNRRMPEEINRIATDHISDLLFAPTQNALKLLAREGLAERAFFTGDVMYDSILFYNRLVNERHRPQSIGDLETFYLATIHRPENTDNAQRLKNIFAAFARLDKPVVLPLHPRTQKLIKNLSVGENVKIIEPVSYLQMIYLLKQCAMVLTDSGGLQKEAYFTGKMCVTLRDETEWVETLENGWNVIVGADTQKILQAVSRPVPGSQLRAFGDGHAAEKVVEILTKK
jgi:UDP-GlcNAc3NAcA epimerase